MKSWKFKCDNFNSTWNYVAGPRPSKNDEEINVVLASDLDQALFELERSKNRHNADYSSQLALINLLTEENKKLKKELQAQKEASNHLDDKFMDWGIEE